MDLEAQIKALGPREVLRRLEAMGHPRLSEIRDYVESMWEWWARSDQLAPQGHWTRWLILAGRGWGKTRTGVEWVKAKALSNPGCRIALVGRTAADVYGVMLDGDSGLLRRAAPGQRPEHNPSKRRVTWPNGSVAETFSAEEPNQLRGPQFHFAWCDELAAWFDHDAWDQLQFGLRLGTHPQVVITTTPRPVAVIRELMATSGTLVTRGRTYDNRANLAPGFFDAVLRKYEGTKLGRQELEGEVLEDVEGALWTRALLDRARSDKTPPGFVRVVVGVDPATTSGEGSDLTGIIVAGLDATGRAWVLADHSLRGTPEQWAQAVVSAYHHHRANLVVAETNQGGEMVAALLRNIDATVPIRRRHAKVGKRLRAEPVAMLYEQNRVSHVPGLRSLEDQLATWSPMSGDESPDRMDALVYAVGELMQSEVAIPTQHGPVVNPAEQERQRLIERDLARAFEADRAFPAWEYT